MNTYTWQIQNLDYVAIDNGQPNVITNIHWKLLGSNGTHSSEVFGVQFLSFDAANSFVKYENLTEETVIAWLISILGNEQINSFKASVDAQIELQINPVCKRGLPWAYEASQVAQIPA